MCPTAMPENKSLPLKRELSRLLLAALKPYGASISLEELEASFAPPKEEKFGDLSTHAVLKIAKEMKKPPRALAETLLAELRKALPASGLHDRVAKIEVEGPGFLNFYHSQKET